MNLRYQLFPRQEMCEAKLGKPQEKPKSTILKYNCQQAYDRF